MIRQKNGCVLCSSSSSSSFYMAIILLVVRCVFVVVVRRQRKFICTFPRCFSLFLSAIIFFSCVYRPFSSPEFLITPNHNMQLWNWAFCATFKMIKSNGVCVCALFSLWIFHPTKCYFPVHNTCCLISSHSFSGEVVCHFTLNRTASFVCNNMLKSFAYFCFCLQLLAPQQTTPIRELSECTRKKKRTKELSKN